MKLNTTRTGLEIAVVGMAGVFPGALTIAEFWQGLLAGNSAISLLNDEELLASGVHPGLLAQDNFVRAKGIFPDLEYFDAKFFDYTPRDAAMLDPQVRALHQCVYHALEDAGFGGDDYKGSIGLFAGASGNFVWELATLLAIKGGSASQFAAIQLNDKDFLATRLAYKLNLRGPAVTLHCACSTSLYAIDAACRQLLTGACSVAVAAGSGLTLPHKNGYLYEEGMIKSKDGTCGPFSDGANGTVEGNGMGAVVLKSLEDAIKDRDRIYAVIRGTAANNDGARKVGYSAPSVEGQAEVIRRALHMADVEATSISYIEAHGTGTALGDPIEIEGLKKAFATSETGFCGIGSLKSNIGHLDTAAGVSSFIKAVMALKEKRIPASIHFNAPNPGIDFANSPFYVVQETRDWANQPVPGSPDQYQPLRAGISSFGIGGTNVHVILEEAPELPPASPAREWQLLCLSGFDEAALQRQQQALLEHLLAHPAQAAVSEAGTFLADVLETEEQAANADRSHLADLAFTLQTGRRRLPCRMAAVYQDRAGLLKLLQEGEGVRKQPRAAGKARLAFLFSGQGTQYPGMGTGLYQSEAVFRSELDACLLLCEQHGQMDVRRLLTQAASTDADTLAADSALLNRTDVAQAALFSLEYAMARLFIEWGMKPAAMIGHSLGEYVAACVAGVLTLEQALPLVLTRGRLMRAIDAGSMLAVASSASELEALLLPGVDLAAVNAPQQCTVSGPHDAIAAFEALLATHNISAKRLHTSHAFHSAMMEPMLDEFRRALHEVTWKPPQLAYISNVSGDWITPEQAQDPEYWVRHLRHAVHFSAGASQLLQDGTLVYLELGPGTVLGSFLKQHASGAPPQVVSALRHVKSPDSDARHLLRALGDLWLNSVQPNWKRYYRKQARNKIALPQYPFEKQAFSIGNADIYRLLEGSGAGPGNGAGDAGNRGDGGVGGDGADRGYGTDGGYGADGGDAGYGADRGHAADASGDAGQHGRANHGGQQTGGLKAVSGSARQPSGRAQAHLTLVPGWQYASTPSTDEAFTVRPCLALIEHAATLPALMQVSGLRLDHARLGTRFQARGAGQFALDFSRVSDFRRLIGALKASDGVPSSVVWLAGPLGGPFRPLAERLQKLALALCAECPGQQFKCVLFIASPAGRSGGSHDDSLPAAEIEAFVRSLRATHPEFDLRAVLLDPKLAVPQRAAQMEGEIYDTDSATLLAQYRQQRRQVYRPLPAPPCHAALDTYRQQTLALLCPPQVDGQALAAAMSELCGAQVLPLQYGNTPAAASAIPLDMAALRHYLREQQQDLRRYGFDDFSHSHALMDEACTRLVVDYIEPIFALDAGREFTREQLQAGLRITARLGKYVDYFLAMLVEDGLLRQSGEHYAVLRGGASLRPLDLIKQELQAQNTRFDGQLRLLEHCVAAFPKALAEDIAAIEVLYPEGKNELLRQTYENSIQDLEDNLIRVIFEQVVNQIIAHAGNRPIRILEGGGGYGLMMRRIVPLLAGLEVEYYFTDIGKTFLYDARQFALEGGYDFLTFGNFDLTRPPEEQGLQANSFDLVLAFNVVHATRSLGATMGNLKALLKDGGLMCLLERTRMRRYVDLVWGLADGWWHFDESERQLSPLCGLEQWEAIARGIGFDDVLGYPETPAMRAQLDVGVLIARTALAPAAAWQASAPVVEPLPEGVKADGVIVLEAWHDRVQESFEPFGDALVQSRLPDQAANHAALLEWLATVQPGFVSVWSSGNSLSNAADQVQRAHLAQVLDEAGRKLLASGNWSRLVLPLASIPAPGLLREALRIMQGGLQQAILQPGTQSLYALRAPATVPLASAKTGNDKPAGLPDLAGAEGYALLLTGLWSELFGIEHIGPDEDFFEIGGDSLKVAQLTTELEKHGIKLLSNEVFNRPTIRGLAEYLLEHRQNEIGQVRTSEQLEAYWRDKHGIESRYAQIAHDGKTYQLLYLQEAAFQLEGGPHALLRALHMPAALEPHYLVYGLPANVAESTADNTTAEGAPGNAGSGVEAATGQTSQNVTTNTAINLAPGGQIEQVWRAMRLQDTVDPQFIPASVRRVQTSLQAMSQRICAEPVCASYALSPFQKMYLQGASRFSFYLIDFDEPIELPLLERAFTDIVRLQGLMRSNLRRNFFGKPFWDEHSAPKENLPVPLVDLSGYTPRLQEQLLEQLMESEYQADFDSADGVMYRLMLIRLDRRRHTLLFNLDHSIFDNMSGQVLRRQLLNRYRALAAGSNAALEPVKGFRDYLDQLNRGPQGVSKARLIELFDLQRYHTAKLKVEDQIVANRQSNIGKLKFELDLDQYHLSDDDEATWELTLLVLSCTLSRFLQLDDVPLKIVYQGRKYQDLSYFDTLGLFVDVLPLLVRVDRNDLAGMIESIKRKVRFVNRYNVSFMNMLLNLSMRFKWWDVLAPVGPKKLPHRDPMILLNYAGKAEAEYQKVIDFATRQMEKSEKKLDYASFYTIVTVVERKIVFDVFCSFAPDMGYLRQLFEEEAARMLPQVSTSNAMAAADDAATGADTMATSGAATASDAHDVKREAA